jgi:hypothetical protein
MRSEAPRTKPPKTARKAAFVGVILLELVEVGVDATVKALGVVKDDEDVGVWEAAIMLAMSVPCCALCLDVPEVLLRFSRLPRLSDFCGAPS